MGATLVGSQIPYLKAVKAVRANFITGCSNSPDVCAVRARGLCWAEQLAWDEPPCEPCIGVPGECKGCPEFFTPTAHPEVLDAVRRLRKPKVLAWNFGGDAWCKGVTPEMRRPMWEAVRDAPQHQHIFLTKAFEHFEEAELVPMRSAWFGLSICHQADLKRIADNYERLQKPGSCKWWFSYEPLLGPLKIGNGHFARQMFAVVGGLSDGNGRIVPPAEGGTRAEWVQPILDAAAEAGCLIYTKNLAGIWRSLTNPRTGERMKSPRELREIPPEWRIEARHGE